LIATGPGVKLTTSGAQVQRTTEQMFHQATLETTSTTTTATTVVVVVVVVGGGGDLGV